VNHDRLGAEEMEYLKEVVDRMSTREESSKVDEE
jgi:hypothetical protein